MPACSACGHDNVFGAAVCAYCNTPIVERDLEDCTIPAKPPLLLPAQIERPWPPVEEPRFDSAIMLHFDNDFAPVVVPLIKQVILGRLTPHSTVRIDIDLSPYDALEQGVSRAHAAIRRTKHGLTVEDLASTNGTYLNGEKLSPFYPKPLESGDYLRLGMLEVIVRFRL